jgi:hypothetical protein
MRHGLKPADEIRFANRHLDRLAARFRVPLGSFNPRMESPSMKKLLVGLLAMSVLLSVAAVAQYSGTEGTESKDKAAAAAPLKTLKGTIKADGDKYTFVNDKDEKSWEIMNPEAVKGHEGHHVSLSAHVYADKDQIHVMKVTMMKEKTAKDDTMKK